MSLTDFEARAENYFKKLSSENEELSDFIDSLTYSFFSGGKRVRPHLLYTISDDLKINPDNVFCAAFAIELVHTYSLIHDDLPAMDDDKYRRGKLTHHAKFGEASAILAGDALLTLAFEVLAEGYDGVKLKSILKTLSSSAGLLGMVGGQALDCLTLKRSTMIFNQIHYLKTAKLFEFCFLAPGYLAGLKVEKLHALKALGRDLGLLFQLQDDLFDLDKADDRKEENIISVVSKTQLENLIADKKTGIKNNLLHFGTLPKTQDLIEKVFKRVK